MTSPEARVVHHVTGRMRLRIPSRRNDAPYFEETAEALRACPGIDTIIANPATGSVLLLHRSSREAIAAFAESRGLFHVADEAARGTPGDHVASAVDAVTAHLDRALNEATRNTGDLRTVAFLGLLAAATVQVMRGQALPAGLTLANYALQVLPKR